MQSGANTYLARVNGAPTTPGAEAMHIAIPQTWFAGPDAPTNLVVDLGAPDPLPAAQPPPQPASATGLAGKQVVLDPGHGEVHQGVNDPGARNPHLNLCERDLVRHQADLIARALQAQGAAVTIIDNGTDLPLRAIGKHGAGSDCFVSLHLNAFNATAQGHEVLIDTHAIAADQQLAHAINTELDAALSIPNRGVKRQGLGVLRGVPLPAPAVLVEPFFIDAVADQSAMDQLVATSAQAIAQRIVRFLSG